MIGALTFYAFIQSDLSEERETTAIGNKAAGSFPLLTMNVCALSLCMCAQHGSVLHSWKRGFQVKNIQEIYNEFLTNN